MYTKYWSVYFDGNRKWVLTFHSEAWWERGTSSGHTKQEVETFLQNTEYPVIWQ